MKEKLKNIFLGKIIAIGEMPKENSCQITGAGMMFRLFINFLSRHNYEVQVFSLVDKESSRDGRKIGSLSLNRMYFYIKLIPKIWLSMLSNRCRIYLIIGPSIVAFIRDALIIWPAYLCKRRIVCHQFGDYVSFYKKQNVIFRWVIRVTLNRTKHLIVEGSPVKNNFSFLFNHLEKVVVIPNGLPERNLDIPSRHKTITKQEIVRLLYMSNMIESKGYWDVLEATRILVNDKRIKLKCHFAGKFLSAKDSKKYPNPDRARKAFFEYIQMNKLEDYVTYSDFIIGNEKSSMFREAHFFLLPTNYIYESQPVSIIEAMAYGAVVISTNKKLIPMMVSDKNTGCIVPYGKPYAIVDAIQNLINNPNEFESYSKNSMLEYHKKFTADSYCKNVFVVVAGQ